MNGNDVMRDIAATLLAVAENPPASTAGPHAFEGRADRWCEVCNRPDRDPIHHMPDKAKGG